MKSLKRQAEAVVVRHKHCVLYRTLFDGYQSWHDFIIDTWLYMSGLASFMVVYVKGFFCFKYAK